MYSYEGGRFKMAPLKQSKNGHTEFEYSFPRLLYTIALESFRNLKKTTHISVDKNGNGGKVIRVEVER